MLALLAVAPEARAGAAATAGTRVNVVEVSGFIDPIEADFIRSSLRDAERHAVAALVIQLNSAGALVGHATIDGLASRIAHAGVPVAVWVGTGGDARGGAAALLRATPLGGAAPGSHVSGRAPASRAPTLGQFIVDLDGKQFAGRTIHIPFKVVRGGNGIPRRQPDIDVSFSKLGLLERLLHTVASPSVAYLLLVAGLLLLVFEFFTVGVGIAGVVGAGALVLAAYGLGVLPTTVAGLVLLVASVGGFAVDVQAGAPRFWTGFGVVAGIVGSSLLFSPHPVSWLAIALVNAGMLLFMLAAMPAVVRARFSTPTIGRQSMIGEMGAATTSVAPEGVVRVRGALWRARTNRATPIPSGDPVRVVAIDGLLLEVEPETGAARAARH